MTEVDQQADWWRGDTWSHPPRPADTGNPSSRPDLDGDTSSILPTYRYGEVFASPFVATPDRVRRRLWRRPIVVLAVACLILAAAAAGVFVASSSTPTPVPAPSVTVPGGGATTGAGHATDTPIPASNGIYVPPSGASSAGAGTAPLGPAPSGPTVPARYSGSGPRR